LTTVTYPDGVIFTTTALTDTQVDTALQILSAQSVGLLTSPLTLLFTFTLNSNVATVPSVSLLYDNQLVVAPDLPIGTTIVSISGLNVTLSNAATASGSQNATVTDPLVWNTVRIGWQLSGQPGPDVLTDTITVRSTPIDTEFSRLRNSIGLPPESTVITQQDVYTRTWSVHWELYGSDAILNAKLIQSALIKASFADALLSALNLYVNPNIKEPIRNPELFQGQWWERVDFDAEFNEEITETLTVNTVASVEVEIFTKDGQIADFTVTV
jgi:hypothetical protein